MTFNISNRASAEEKELEQPVSNSTSIVNSDNEKIISDVENNYSTSSKAKEDNTPQTIPALFLLIGVRIKLI